MPRGVEKIEIVDGTTLRRMLAEKSVSQRDLAKKAGVTHYRICDIAKVGIKTRVRVSTAKKIAAALGVSLAALSGQHIEERNLNDDEAAVLEMYKELDVIQRAEALLKMKTMINENESNQ